MSKAAKPEGFLPLTPIHFHILLAVSDEPRHGYGIMKEVERMTGGEFTIAAGTMYNSIKSLLRDGLIKVIDEDGNDQRRTRTYAITGIGEKTLAAEVRRLRATVRVAEQKPALGGLRTAGGGVW